MQSPELADRLIELYCDWRNRCQDVRAAYHHFTTASGADRTAAFAVYMAALDREQSAADAYAEQMRSPAAPAGNPGPGTVNPGVALRREHCVDGARWRPDQARN